jgi:hypothetical protein
MSTETKGKLPDGVSGATCLHHDPMVSQRACCGWIRRTVRHQWMAFRVDLAREGFKQKTRFIPGRLKRALSAESNH